MCTGKCGDFAAEIAGGSLDTLAQREALKTADLIGAPAFASASLSACATLCLPFSSNM